MKFQNSFWRSSGVLAVLVLESLPLQPLVAAQSPAKHKHAQRPTKQKSVAEPIWDLVITGGMVVTMDRPHRILSAAASPLSRTCITLRTPSLKKRKPPECAERWARPSSIFPPQTTRPTTQCSNIRRNF